MLSPSNIFIKITRIPNRIRLMKAVKDWQKLHTAINSNQGGIFTLRNGLTIRSNDGFSSGVIREIYFYQPYGTIPKDAIIIDIGANIGTFTLQAATAHPNNRIFAYEPLPKNFRTLKNNLRNNKLNERVCAFPYAIGGKKGQRQLFVHGSPHSSLSKAIGGSTSISVKTITISDIFQDNHLDNCDLLKLDCEGSEYEIIYNTPFEILKKIKRIAMEYHINLNDPKKQLSTLLDFLKNHGFKITKLKRDAQNTGGEIGIIWAKRS